MAETRWRLNDTSVLGIPVGGYNFASSNNSYSLNNISGVTLSRTTSSPSPYEGAGCYQGSQSTPDENLWSVSKFNGSGYENVAGQVCYIDMILYLGGSSKYVTPFTTGNNTTLEYSWVNLNTLNGKIGIYTYEEFSFPQSQTRAESASGVIPANEWFRLLMVLGTKGPVGAQIFKGDGILGTIPNSEITWASSAFSNYEWLAGGAGNSGTYFDDIILNDTTSPNRNASTSTYKLGYGISRY